MAVVTPPKAGETPISGVLRNKTLHNEAAATGDGSILDVSGMSTVVLTLSTTGFSGTVLFKASQDGTNYDTIVARRSTTRYKATGTGTLSTNTSVSVWKVDVSGYSYFKAPITRTAGTITITASASPLVLSDKEEMGELVIKLVTAQAITASTPYTAWDPASTVRFRLLGFAFSSSANAYIILKDDTTAFLQTPLLAAAGVYSATLPDEGYRSAALNNNLGVDVSANSTVTGYLWGREEV